MSSESSEHQRDYRECKKKKLVKQPKLNIFAMGEGPGIETHPTGGARSSSHGIDFERELTMLWTYRAYRSGKEYTVAIEDERTGKFDDYCINIKLDDGTILQQFVQLKHSSQKSPKLTNLDLFPSKSSSKNVFDLTLYFQSFLKIKNCPEFELSERSKQRFILFTNRTLTFGGNIGKFEFCESMFEKERESEILNTDIFKFKDEFPGRDSLKDLLSTNVNDLEYVDQFLQNFYIAESQPDGNNVSELLKSELSNDFKEMHCENAYYEFYVNYLKWYTAKDGNKGTRLSHTEIKKYFDNIKHHVVKQTSFELMDPAANFYGREDIIAKIREQLTTIPKSTSHVIDVSISGMSGVGKTEIARYYAKEYRDTYDYTLWLNASSQQSLDASFERLNDFLNIKDNDEKQSNAKISVEKEISKDRITKIYSFLKNYKCLLIFDSECDLLKQELLNHMRQYLPLTKCNDHHFIVTTQIQNLPCNFEEHVDNFSQKETLGFLKQNLNANLYENDFELITLGKCLSNVSLALQIATSYIKENDRRYRISGKSYSVNNFLDEYQKEGILVLNYKSKDLANKSLITLCELSIQSMLNSKEKARHLSLQILYIIAHLQPDHISIKIFDSKKKNSEDLLQDAILMLEVHSLITVSSGHISIHRLTQDILRAKLQQISEKEKNDDESFFEVDKKGQILYLDPKEMIESGNYNKEYILLIGLNMFQESFNSVNCASDDEQIITKNVISRHSITFIAHCIENTYVVYAHLCFMLSAFNYVTQYQDCLQCIYFLKNISNNLKHYVTVNEMNNAKFLIKSLLAEKYILVRDIRRFLEVFLECQNILDHYKIPFKQIVPHYLKSIKFLTSIEHKRESFELLFKLYVLFDDYTNLQKHRLQHNEIKNACVLGTLLQDHLKFEEAIKVFETIRQQESLMCQNNLIPNEERCECVVIALSLSCLYCLQKKHFEAIQVLLCAKKCNKVPSKHNEVQNYYTFFDYLCYLHYQCGETTNSISVLNEISKVPFPALEISDSIELKTILANFTAIYLEIDEKFSKSVDVLISALYNLLVTYKKCNILNVSKRMKFPVNNVIFIEHEVKHNQAHPFELLLFNAIHLSYAHFGFEFAFANLLKIEKSVLENFGHTTEINSYILMCKLSLYKREKKHILEIQTWIKILQLWYQLSKDSDSIFFMFRIALLKFLNEKHLEKYFDSIFAEQLLEIVKKAIDVVTNSSSFKNKIGTTMLQYQYFKCLLITKKYNVAENFGFHILSSTSLSNIEDIKLICEVHGNLALHFYKIKNETSKAIEILNKCFELMKNLTYDANLFSLTMNNEFRILNVSVVAVNKRTIKEFRIIELVKCYIQKSKIYYDTGESSKGWDTLQDCMYKMQDFNISNASYIPTVKEILLHLIEVGETKKALQYINDKCKLDNNNLEVFGACELFRIKAKLQFKIEKNTDAIETLWKLWKKKLTIVSKTSIYKYRNTDFLDQIKNILLKLENDLSWYIIDNGAVIKSVENLCGIEKESSFNIELTFYIAFCNYLLGSYRECMRAIESVEKLLECCNFKNEELDNIAFDSSILKQRCNVCLNSL